LYSSGIPKDVSVLFSLNTFLGLTQLPILGIMWVLPLGINLPGRVAYDTNPNNITVKNVWSYVYTPPYVFLV
jgi:hypothetical protein